MSLTKVTCLGFLTLALSWLSPMAQRDSSTKSLSAAARAINALAVDLLTKGKPSTPNALLSPYSIQFALAMTYAGADGKTREEMAAVLNYPDDESALHDSFAALEGALSAITERTAREVADAAKDPWAFAHVTGADSLGAPLTLVTANRLFGQEGYAFREPFLDLVRDKYAAPLQLLDFKQQAEQARLQINTWVEEQTRQRIVELIPPEGVDSTSRLVLVNAIYLKASWVGGFDPSATQPRPFHVRGGAPVDVPTMQRKSSFGYSTQEGYTVVTVPYTGEEIHFLILLPDEGTSLAVFEAGLTAEKLKSAASALPQEVILELPKFRIEPPLMKLGERLRALGMRTAFNEPVGSANFDRMAPRRPDDYLCISEVYHKTFLNLDEHGTEAAGATAVGIRLGAGYRPPPPPPEVIRIDRPFVFAIQHRSSGACLFIGHVIDPR